MLGMLGIYNEWNLVRAERTLNLQAIDEFWSRPSLGRSENDHRPTRSGRVLASPRVSVDVLDLLNGKVQGGGHELMHRLRVVALHEVGRPAAPAQELFQFFVLNAGKNRRVADFVAVKVKDRQDGAVRNRVQKLIGLPRGRERARFCSATPLAPHSITPG